MISVWNGEVNICERVSSTNGETCPEQGTYTINTFKLAIPGDTESWYSEYGYWGMSVGVDAVFTIDGSETVCTVGIKLSKANGYTMVYGAGLAFAAFLSLGFGVRRRRVAKIQLSPEEGTQAHFEMMPNGATAAV